MNKETLEITKKFHDTYEKLASEYTYETREDTKVFDINSNNGKLMYATVNEIVRPILKENKQLKDNWNYIKKMLKEARQEEFNITGYCGTCTDVDIDFLLNKMQELEGSDN